MKPIRNPPKKIANYLQDLKVESGIPKEEALTTEEVTQEMEDILFYLHLGLNRLSKLQFRINKLGVRKTPPNTPRTEPLPF